MKRTISVFLIMTMLIALITGCGNGSRAKKNSDGLYVNNEFNSTSMVNINGKEQTVEDTSGFINILNYGVSVMKPEIWNQVPEKDLLILKMGNGFSVIYYPQEVKDEYDSMDFDSMSDDEINAYYETLYKRIAFVCTLYIVDSENKSNTSPAAEDYLDKNEQLVVNGNRTINITYNDSVPEGFDEENASYVQDIIDGIDEIKNGIMLYPDKANLSGFEGDISSFSTKDMEGNEVTQEIFKNYDITMINIWETTCGYCVKEMPDLQKLYEQLPENVNMITICYDAENKNDDAKKILSSCKATFTTLYSNDDINEKLINKISGFPTTIFVNSNGEIVGQVKVGGFIDNALEGYQNLVDTALEYVS